ncbi:MAG: putative toxin-antitoxin system toxin component, PIN family [Deltaproteobacteria bacterium]|nr:putative toxin-antitoxin system toxin component, PIN family [Deltaproteobacteria bacterium]MBW2049956.1 putative toxin-antitoxin system toxin component, PIN family [Deltaproteobacteria bacterium]MBW2112295.1 putative toxin-antitoxin system toxin component, PIN family [Deltaproteobacteria bacterium]MBW2352716.1 putative toxin-antitoxin system toxin component, PIN family [Deltaproteobacteria bacterium]HDZ90161.1 putative toxin-antitoxin system toxin component, PIN family [Deltaproteobacteria b
MKIIIDTNVALSGLLWGGPPNQILKWARDRAIQILACDKTVDELKRVLQYRKFSNRLSVLQNTRQKVLAYFLNLVAFVPDPESVPSIIEADPFDNLFLALASENGATLIVSGDRHLLDLESFNNIQIVTPSEGVQTISHILTIR